MAIKDTGHWSYLRKVLWLFLDIGRMGDYDLQKVSNLCQLGDIDAFVLNQVAKT